MFQQMPGLRCMSRRRLPHDQKDEIAQRAAAGCIDLFVAAMAGLLALLSAQAVSAATMTPRRFVDREAAVSAFRGQFKIVAPSQPR
jgi:uncharacterized membrane protein (DUF4010 family)